MATAITMLQELMQRYRLPLPVYDVVDSQAGTHDNTFRIRVQAKGQSAIGVGKSKKEAKQLAAQILLEMLTGRKQEFQRLELVDLRNTSPQNEFSADKSAIAILQEMMQQKNYSLPIYTLVSSQSGTHLNVFEYKVQVLGQSAFGVGSSKKEAKHKAAQNMLDLLASLQKNPDSRQIKVAINPQEDIQISMELITKRADKLTLSSDNDFRQENTSKEANLDGARKMLFQDNVIANAVGVLQEFLIKKNYPPPNYVLLHSSVDSNQSIFVYRVEISEEFSAVGSGVSKKDAKQDAAQKLLHSLANKSNLHDNSTVRKMHDDGNIKREQDTPDGTAGHNNPKACESLFDSIELPLIPQENTKTPVAVLMELAQTKKWPTLPTFELIACKAGTHLNVFEYKVEAFGHTAVGVANSKKEAKHLAAQNMLDLLAEKGDYKRDKPSTNIDPSKWFRERSFQNVTYSQPNCLKDHLDALFGKTNCKLITSKAVFGRIMDILPELKQNCQSEDMEIADRDMVVLEKYNAFSPNRMNLNMHVCDFDRQFKIAMQEKEIPLETVQKYFELPKTEETLTNLLNVFDYQFKIEEIQMDPVLISTLAINSDVPLWFMEMGDMEEAREKLLDEAFTVLQALMLP